MPRVAHRVFKALQQIITIKSSANVYQTVKYQGTYVVFFWLRHRLYIYISCIPHSIPLVVSHWSHVVNKPSLENLKANSTGKLHHFITSSGLTDYQSHPSEEYSLNHPANGVAKEQQKNRSTLNHVFSKAVFTVALGEAVLMCRIIPAGIFIPANRIHHACDNVRALTTNNNLPLGILT